VLALTIATPVAVPGGEFDRLSRDDPIALLIA
jgi:hypothetical protein